MTKYSYSSEWIHHLEKNSHWNLYWYQQYIMQDFLEKNDNMLEIGIGSGFTSNYLKSKGYNVTTVDIDEKKNPDIVANFVEYSFKKTFDHVLAFEVFEHVPYDEFIFSLEKLHSICNRTFFFSVPRNEKTIFKISALLPFFGNVNMAVNILKNKITTKNHHWEVDYKQIKKNKLIKDIESKNFQIERISKFSSQLFFVILPK